MHKERIIIIIFNEGTRMDIKIIKWFPFCYILALWIKVHSSPVHLRILVPRVASPATGPWALVARAMSLANGLECTLIHRARMYLNPLQSQFVCQR